MSSFFVVIRHFSCYNNKKDWKVGSHMLKKTVLWVLCVGLLFFMAGCSTSVTPPPATNPTTAATLSGTEPSSVPTEPVPSSEPTVPTDPPATEPEPVVDPDALWTPICNEYIQLRATPGGNPIAQIPVDATVVLDKWCGKYALVTYEDLQGYVLSNYIKPADKDYFTKCLQVVTPVSQYSYEQMQADISALQLQYPNDVRTASIGMSEMGRRIPVLQIGNPQAEYHVLMQGAMHGREHFTACLLMALADYSLSQGYFADGKVCYHIIPMSNPDGVVISQTQKLDSTQNAIYQSDLAAGYTSSGAAYYAQQWKANALGIDLNRNFISGWDASLERPNPSSEKYRGESAFSAAESQALRDYTQQCSFDATISVHSHGSVIYYQYGKKQPVNDLSYSLALTANQVTGYELMTYDGTTGAGYKDWAMDALGIPSLTLEIGCMETPLATQDIYNTFARCKELLPAINTWLQQN